MKRLLCQISLLILELIALPACDCRDETPGISQKVLDLMGDTANCSCDAEFREYFWKGRVVYAVVVTDPVCNWALTVYDQNGNGIPLPDGYSYDDFVADATFRGVVLKCD